MIRDKKMLKIAIIEDEQIHKELLADYLRTWGKEHKTPISIQGFPSAESFLFAWAETNDFDILFVDIQMREMNGVEMARKVRAQNEEIAIVFTTGITDYMESGYEVEALHYLLKPINMDKVGQCMDKVLRRSHKEPYLLLHGREETIRIPVDKITYAEARGHGCILETYTKMGEGTQIEITESISELEKQLNQHGFIRCHRSYLCRIGSIHQIGRTDITLDSGSVIPVSRRMYAELNRKFIEYFRKI
ncbi:MAG: LytTR family DNA-binding domain-containing protein [Eubacterium sp.]|nr:LytTR family DNA-binding domain-containing protein [Eubacterium sp.]